MWMNQPEKKYKVISPQITFGYNGVIHSDRSGHFTFPGEKAHRTSTLETQVMSQQEDPADGMTFFEIGKTFYG